MSHLRNSTAQHLRKCVIIYPNTPADAAGRFSGEGANPISPMGRDTPAVSIYTKMTNEG